MAQKASGQVLERHWKAGCGYALRFNAYGERRYLTLGLEAEGWSRKRAEEELANVLADVRRGIWVPPGRRKRRSESAAGPGEAPLFGPFARDLVAARKGQVSEATHRYESWLLGHLLPFFAEWPLAEIDIAAVDAYRSFKVEEAEARRRAIERGRPQLTVNGQAHRPLSPSSINKTIDLLQWVLSVALEYRHVTENAAVGRRRRLREEKRRPVHLDSTEQIEALLDAAAELDRQPRHYYKDRAAIIATLLLAGPRAHELCNLLWRDVDLANGRIHIGRSKTQAGLREIAMLPLLRDILAAHKAAAYRSGPEDPVFPTGTGGLRDKDSLRGRVLGPTLERANRLLAERGHVPLPVGISPHKLRHTFASVLIACGEDPISVMRQLGHTDPAFTLRTYAHLMSRNPGERARLEALVKEGKRASATPEPRLPLERRAYELAILRALGERGGSAKRRQILAVIETALGERLSEVDRERLPSGPVRWQVQVDVARRELVRRGLLKSGTRQGVWELARAGVERLRRAERARAAAQEGRAQDIGVGAREEVLR